MTQQNFCSIWSDNIRRNAGNITFYYGKKVDADNSTNKEESKWWLNHARRGAFHGVLALSGVVQIITLIMSQQVKKEKKNNCR